MLFSLFPSIGGAVSFTSLALGGATIGTNALAVTGTAAISSTLGAGSIQSGPSGYSVWGTSAGVGTPKIAFDQVSAGTAGVIYVSSDSIIGFNSATSLLSGGVDTGFSRISAGVIGIGTGAAGSVAGQVNAAAFMTTVALNTTVDGAGTPAFTANMAGSTGGPVTAAQNGWVKMKDSAGATIWVPVWK